MDNYLNELNNNVENNHEFLETLRVYAEEHDVPIIKRDSLVLIESILKIINAKKVLEIGTAIAYSAISFSSQTGVCVDTIERDPKMYEQAIKNINEIGLSDKVKVHFIDALEIDVNELSTYDAIFIDAAKGQYIKFFDKFSPLLNEGGVIFTDNIIFHGCVENQENLSRNLRSLVRKINDYNHYLNEIEGYDTSYLNIGDGLAVTVRKK